MKTINEMTLKEKLGQLILAGFHQTYYDDTLKSLIEDYHVGNIILFTRNFDNVQDLYKLTKKIHEESIKHNGNIPLIAIDQEGGQVTRLMKEVTFAPGAMTSSASHYNNASYLCGKMLASDMIKLGINFNLAPSLDINNNMNNAVINVRSYGDTKERVAKLGHDFIKGTTEEGVLSCAKHFPGHGDCVVDSHLGLPKLEFDEERLFNLEMYPFIQNINVPAIMSAHILFPSLDTVPSTLSHTFLTDILRHKLGFKGLIVTDCLEMQAIKNFYGTINGAKQAILAGADLACISHTFEYQVGTINALLDAINNNEISIEEIDKKVLHILDTKEKTYPYLVKNFYNQDLQPFDSSYNKISYDIVEQSITKVIGDVPLLDEDTLVIAPQAVARTIIEDEFDNRNLPKNLKLAFSNIDSIYELKLDSDEFISNMRSIARNYKKVILFTYNAIFNKKMVEFYNELISLNKDNTYIISMKGPMDYPLYNNMTNYICMYEYTPNSIKSIIELLKGNIQPLGTLPIKL